MSITIEMHPQEIDALKQITQLSNEADAIMHAAREFLRISQLRELKTASGRMEFDSNWQRLEELELKESALP